MIVAFRVDASEGMGSGHVMRCIALAEALQERQHEVIFICAELEGNLIDKLKGLAFEVWPLNSSNDYQCAQGWDWQLDAEDTLALVERHQKAVDWLCVDHYQLDARWERIVGGCGARIAVIDDLADRWHACDVLVDQNAIEANHLRYNNLVPGSCLKLLGPRYTLLRKEFSDVSEQRRECSEVLGTTGNILVFLGGADSGNYTLHLLQSIDLQHLAFPLHVLIGPMNPWKNDVIEWCRKQNVAFTVAHDRIGDLLKCTRAAVVACGMFAVELQALEVPCALIPLSDIQATVAHYFSSQGRAIVVEPTALSDPNQVLDAVTKLLALPYLSTGAGVVPVDGARQVICHLESYV